jgi:coiled-coil domain-containing protein 40
MEKWVLNICDANVNNGRRQIMMWEKKIQLAKETSEAVNPSVGQEDIRKMEREIHIMEMRHGQLQRDQKKLIEEMERLIYKRELIANKGRAQAALKKGVVTKSSLKREVAAQAQELEKEKQAAFRCDQQIKELYADQRVLSEEVESLAYALEERRKQRYELEAEMQDTANEKARFIDLKARCLRLIQRFSDIKDDKFRPTTRPESVEEELHMQTERRHQIEALLEELIHRLPESEAQVLKIKAVFN